MITNKSLLDFGCGAGGVLRMASEFALRAVGVELEIPMQKQLVKEGYTCYHSLDEALGHEKKERFDIITLFHVLEHLPNPVSTLQNLRNLLTGDGGYDCGGIKK